jgi:diguanylate cyclase (GGDEF)-like protein
LNEIRAGEAPMSELDRVGGGARSMVEPIRSVLLDLKEQKRINTELSGEMRSRILSRTDALERQLGSIKAQAQRDPLTALGNRLAFETGFPQMFAACRSASQDLCVLMIDLDNFKPLNDTLGHAAGDDFLKQTGELIRSSIRDHDGAYRVGGDEFVIVLPRASRPIGEKLAGRLASLIDHLARPMRLPHPPGLSIGVAALSDGKITDHADLLARADKSLYAVKQNKPNRKPRAA